MFPSLVKDDSFIQKSALFHDSSPRRQRRGSLACKAANTFIIDVQRTLKELLHSEDTNGDQQITIEDKGPKAISLRTGQSGGFRRSEIRGTYMLSNLLQELTLANLEAKGDFSIGRGQKRLGHGEKTILLNEAQLTENPVDRLSRCIKEIFWKGLTRQIDECSIHLAGRDPKDWTVDPVPRIYVPHGAPEQHLYWQKLGAERPELCLDVQLLPRKITPGYVQQLNEKPGLLALAMEKKRDPATGEERLMGLPFVVPGGRFNELYGWDSYMVSLGLLEDGRVDLAKSMVKHFCFCIEHYGMILNANRSYYLGRSQPPFLTDMALRVFEKIKHEPGALAFLHMAMSAAVKEYNTVWMSCSRLDPTTGLSRYRPDGIGVPPEVEAGHFDHVVEPLAEQHGMDVATFTSSYNAGTLSCPELDTFLLHDRASRESGHDTSYRFVDVCADLATVDLNSLLYKYESDIADTIDKHFDGHLTVLPQFAVDSPNTTDEQGSRIWRARARSRRAAVDKYLWDDEAGFYFDYNTLTHTRTTHESATTFFPLYAGLCSTHQARRLVSHALPALSMPGGIVSTSERSRGLLDGRPQRQWDYPYAWAPHQMLAWIGLRRYGYKHEAARVAYRWLRTMMMPFIHYGGVVVEKYDVCGREDSHRVDAEYGNQGADFKGVAQEGFGWVNASFVVGLTLIDERMKKALALCATWEALEPGYGKRS
ncbi:MAG: hypothetical protein M1825_005016 [Sarcosagium campestre]|nr:MAG: hypothetical protein M1825_005016 [Sarcosagium campestre]